MTNSYELGGVTYHERLPRIVLLNFSDHTRLTLQREGYNVGICQPKEVVDLPTGPRIIFESPKPPHEVDIFLIRDSLIETTIEDKTVNPPKKNNSHAYVEHIIYWPSGYKDHFHHFCRAVITHDGVCCFFVLKKNTNLLHDSQLGYEPNTAMKLWPRKTANIWPECEYLTPLTRFLQRWFDKPDVYVSLSQRQDVGQYQSLLTDNAKINYSAAYWPTPQIENKGFILALPDYGDDPEILKSLVADALPDVIPSAFPFRHDTSWLNESEFQHPLVEELEQQQRSLKRKWKSGLQLLIKKLRLARLSMNSLGTCFSQMVSDLKQRCDKSYKNYCLQLGNRT